MAHQFEFTAASFQRIAIVESRRGRDDPAQQFPEVERVIRELKDVYKLRRSTCSPLWKRNHDRAKLEYASFRPRINELRAKKAKKLHVELQNVSLNFSSLLSEGIFCWGLEEGEQIKGKQTYAINDDPDRYFDAKQVEMNLKRAFGTESPNRNRLIAQLRDAMDGRVPKYILRTDLHQFFESIPHSLVIERLRSRRSLSETTIELVQILLHEWSMMTGQPIGVPRGVGISTLLSEVVGQMVDEKVATQSDVLFYGRYVDDIVIVTDSELALESVSKRVSDVVSHLELELNDGKTTKHLPRDSNSFDLDRPMDFLGYRIDKKAGRAVIKISSKTESRYKQRIADAFKKWDETKNPNSGHEGLLLDRIKFLTGNTRLVNSKGRAVTGIYFNYPLLTDAGCLGALDHRLQAELNSRKLPEPLNTRLSRLSFENGFKSKAYYRFSPDQLKRLTAIWRNYA